MKRIADIPKPTLAAFRDGGVIPAHPLALNAEGRLDELRQRALSRYYLDAGSIGIAVGVHTTQFEIREAGLFEPVLTLAAEEAAAKGGTTFMVAGAVGGTKQAVAEAETARKLGYHAVLLSLRNLADADEETLIDHCRAVAEVMPIIGFYLQAAVGGQKLTYKFWKRFAALDNVLGIKVAPFNRYFTLDVVRALVDARAEDRITLYTGNDDHIVGDLMTPFTVMRDGEPVTVRFRGGLLGHWAVWTERAVALLDAVKKAEPNDSVAKWLALDAQTTDANAAVFDAANGFKGCIAGVHEVLRRQGLLETTRCLNPNETMGPGQAEELTRVCRDYPDLTDDAFVTANLDRWLG